MFRRVILALITLALLCGPAAAAEKFIVASDCTWPPMEMLDANKQPEGFSTDYLRAMGKAAGFEVEVRNIAWDGIFGGVATGQYDIVASSVTITPEREKQFDFSDPYYEVAQAVVLPAGKSIKTLADLKGKKVAVTKAAGAHYLLIAALAKANLKFSDIQPAYLTPADGRAAFENGKVDAWVIWEPFLSAAQRQLPTRTLEGSQGLASYQRYYLTSSRFAAAHPQVLQTVYHELAKAGDWLRANPAEAARILGPLWGNLDPAIVEQANGRRSYQVRPVQPDGLGEQQKIADAFFAEGLLPRAVDTRAVATWQPEAEHVQ